MRNASGHILCLLMAITYVFAHMGFGIHTCHDDGCRHFVWMLGDVSCESIHEHDHEHCHEHSHEAGHEHHHDDGCCSTQVYVLTDAQDNAPATADLSAPEMPLPLRAEARAFAPVSAGHRMLLAWDSPPPIRACSSSLLSVWLI